jgi:hypothetical protein
MNNLSYDLVIYSLIKQDKENEIIPKYWIFEKICFQMLSNVIWGLSAKEEYG